jgi:hypothetical protein
MEKESEKRTMVTLKQQTHLVKIAVLHFPHDIIVRQGVQSEMVVLVRN